MNENNQEQNKQNSTSQIWISLTNEFVSFYQQKTRPSEALAEYENRDGVDNKKPNVSITASESVTGISTAISLMEQMEMDRTENSFY